MKFHKGQRVRLVAARGEQGTVVHQWRQDDLVEVRWDYLASDKTPVRMHWPEEIEAVPVKPRN